MPGVTEAWPDRIGRAATADQEGRLLGKGGRQPVEILDQGILVFDVRDAEPDDPRLVLLDGLEEVEEGEVRTEGSRPPSPLAQGEFDQRGGKLVMVTLG